MLTSVEDQNPITNMIGLAPPNNCSLVSGRYETPGGKLLLAEVSRNIENSTQNLCIFASILPYMSSLETLSTTPLEGSSRRIR